MRPITKEFFYEDIRSALCRLYPDAYLGGWNAAEEWDLTNAMPLDFCLFSPFFEKDEAKRLFGIDFFLKKIPLALNYAIERKEGLNGTYAVSDVHKTVVDVLLFEELSGGKEEVIEIVKNYFHSPLCDENHLLFYAKKSGHQRLVSNILHFQKDFK